MLLTRKIMEPTGDHHPKGMGIKFAIPSINIFVHNQINVGNNNKKHFNNSFIIKRNERSRKLFNNSFIKKENVLVTF